MNRRPSLRCASAVKNTRPAESIRDEQPQFQPFSPSPVRSTDFVRPQHFVTLNPRVAYLSPEFFVVCLEKFSQCLAHFFHCTFFNRHASTKTIQRLKFFQPPARPLECHLLLSPSRQVIASSSTRTASSTAITGRAWNSKAGKVEQNL